MTTNFYHHVIFHNFYQGKVIFQSIFGTLDISNVMLESDIFSIATVHHYSTKKLQHLSVSALKNFKGKFSLESSFDNSQK